MHTSVISPPKQDKMKRNSFLGSIKGKLSRSASNASRNSNDDRQDATRMPGQAAQPAAAGPGHQSTNSVSTPLPATQRPAPSEPPPAYSLRDPSPSPARNSTSSHYGSIATSTREDPYAFLSSFDTIFLIDDSSSMRGSRWEEVRAALVAITPICTAHDQDGIDLYFLNHKNPATPTASQGNLLAGVSGKAAGVYANITDRRTIDTIFSRTQPYGMTPTGTRLNSVLKSYLRSYEAAIKANGGDPDGTNIKPINLIVITDGCPSDDPESVLLSVAFKLDKLEAPPHQIGIQFFQVGQDAEATAALKALDDELSEKGGGVRDMVDTVTFDKRVGATSGGGSFSGGGRLVLTPDGILKTVLGAVVKRLDRARLVEEERRSQRSGFLRP